MRPLGLRWTRPAASFLVALSLVALPAFAQQQTPTTPSSTPNLRSLRDSIRKSVTSKNQPGQKTPAANKKTPKERAPASDAGAKTPPPGRKAARTAGGARIALGGAKRGGAAAGGGATGGAGGGAVAKIRIIGEVKYEPIKDREVKYGDVPDAGEELTEMGPMPVGEFLDLLHMTTNWNILVTEAAKAISLEFWIVNTKPKAALEILRFHDIYYEYKKDTNTLYVMTKDEYIEKEFGDLVEHEFVVKNAEVDYVESVITSFLSPAGRMIVDPRTHHIFLWDTEDNLKKIKEAVAELDVSLTKAEFVVSHAEIADIEAILSTFMSSSGNMIVDPRTGNLLVEDLAENIDEMRTVLAKFDVPLIPQTYAIRYIDAETLADSVEMLLTERGTAQVDIRTNSIMVTDLPARQKEIEELIAVLDRELETRTWVLNHVEADLIAERIETIIPEEMGDIIVDEDVHQMTVTGLPERLDQIDELIAVWDVMRSQVRIEAYLVSVSEKLARNLSLKWSYFDSSGNSPQAYRINNGAIPDYTNLTNTMTVGQLPYAEPLRNWVTGDVITDINGQDIIKAFHGNRVAAVLDYLDTTNKAHVISSPSVTVQDGEEAIFQSGKRVPYVTSTTYGARQTYPTNATNQNYNTYSRPYNRIDFIEVGTILRVLPRITDEGTILLEISAEDSDAENVTVISNGEENTIPEKRENSAETQVRVRDGQTIVIGGLRKGNSFQSVSKSVPILGDLPLVGRLFRNKSGEVDNDTLLIFITTTVVSETTSPEAEDLARFDENFAERLRESRKSGLTQLFDRVARRKSDISVSIGQSGYMHCEGKQITLDQLRDKLANLKAPLKTRVIVRKHPLAPNKTVTELMELLLELNVKVEFEKNVRPFVPDYDGKTNEPDLPMADAAPLKEARAN
ncbi:MAG: hypothetical protein GWP08_17980 [Nitrospiraceae bacterium]|nr:hypothetical protein [Nitrospiraceae bacterium]